MVKRRRPRANAAVLTFWCTDSTRPKGQTIEKGAGYVFPQEIVCTRPSFSREHPLITFPSGDSDPVQILAKGNSVFAGGSE
jgi:hypothetical protein